MINPATLKFSRYRCRSFSVKRRSRFLFLDKRDRSCGTKITADADSSSGGFSGAFAPFPPQRELRIITAAYPIATGVKPQPIGIRCTRTNARVGARAHAAGSFVQGERERARAPAHTYLTYVPRGVKTARDVAGTVLSTRLDSTPVNACPKTIV